MLPVHGATIRLFLHVLAATGLPTHEAVVFWILAPIAVLAALGMILVRSAVHAAVLLAVYWSVRYRPAQTAIKSAA